MSISLSTRLVPGIVPLPQAAGGAGRAPELIDIKLPEESIKVEAMDKAYPPAMDHIPSAPPYKEAHDSSSFKPIIDPLFPYGKLSVMQMRERFSYLRGEQWRLCIDGRHAQFGSQAYDRGLHGGKVEPGYLKNMLRVHDFIMKHIDTPLTPDMYLEMHAIGCAHFADRGARKFTYCDRESIGRFRTIRVHMELWPTQRMSDQAEEQLKALDAAVGAAYVRYAKIKPLDDLCEEDIEFLTDTLPIRDHAAVYMSHIVDKLDERKKARIEDLFTSEVETVQLHVSYRACKDEKEMRERFARVLGAYHRDIAKAKTPAQKLYVIARFYQHCEWLHPVADGCGRTDIAVLNMHLVQQGFHPVIMVHPFVSTTFSLDSWLLSLQEGLDNWEREVAKTHRILHPIHPSLQTPIATRRLLLTEIEEEDDPELTALNVLNEADKLKTL